MVETSSAELKVGAFASVATIFVLAGVSASAVPVLVVLNVLVIVAAVHVVRQQPVEATTRLRGWADLGVALGSQILASWLCLLVLISALFETLSESNELAWALFSAAAGMWFVLAAKVLNWWRRRHDPVWSRPMRGGFALSLIALVFGLAAQPVESLTTQPYSDLIGARYEVIADDLHAYGIRSPERQLEYVTLIPGVGIGGREIAFKRRVPPGAEITIRSAWHEFKLLDNGDYYIVSISGTDLPSGIEIKIAMFRGNEGTGVDLNPRVYRRLNEQR